MKGVTFTLTGAILWGLSGTNSEYLMKEYALTPEWVSSVRMIVSGILLLIYVAAADRRAFFGIWKKRTDRVMLLLFSIFGLIANQVAYLYAIAHTNAGTATVLQYISPVIILVAVCLLKRKYPTQRELVGIVLTMFGIFVITTHGNPANLVISPEGLFWGITAAFTLCLYNLLPIGIIHRWGTLPVMGYAMLIGGLAEGAVFWPWREIPAFDAIGWAALAFVVLVGSLLSYTLYLKGVQLIGPVRAGMMASVEPVSATVFTVLIMGTTFTLSDMIGFVMIIATILLLSTGKSKEEAEMPSERTKNI